MIDSRCEAKLGVLSPDERTRAGRFRFATDRHRFVGSRILLRGILGHYLGSEARELSFELNRWGKPSLPAQIGRGLQFSVSRSHDLALLGVGTGPEFGVDVERCLPERADPAIVRRQFSAPERNYVESASDRVTAFFEIWARKEAYIKGLGRGLSHPLGEFSVRPRNPGSPTTVHWSRNAPPETWTVQTVPLPIDGYSAAVATSVACRDIVLVPLTIPSLLSRFC